MSTLIVAEMGTFRPYPGLLLTFPKPLPEFGNATSDARCATRSQKDRTFFPDLFTRNSIAQAPLRHSRSSIARVVSITAGKPCQPLFFAMKAPANASVYLCHFSDASGARRDKRDVPDSRRRIFIPFQRRARARSRNRFESTVTIRPYDYRNTADQTGERSLNFHVAK